MSNTLSPVLGGSLDLAHLTVKSLGRVSGRTSRGGSASDRRAHCAACGTPTIGRRAGQEGSLIVTPPGTSLGGEVRASRLNPPGALRAALTPSAWVIVLRVWVQTIAEWRPCGWPPSHPLRQSPAPKAAGRPLRRWQLNSNELCGADFAILRRLEKTCLNA